MKTRLSKDGAEKTVYEIHIKNTRQTSGRYYEAVNLTTDFELQPKITIRVFGHIE